MNRIFRNALFVAPVLVAGAAHATQALVTIESVEALPGSIARVGVTIEVDDLIGSFAFDAFAGGWEFSHIDYDGPLFVNGWNGWDTTPSSSPNVSAACIFPEDQVTGFQALFTMNIEVPSDVEIGSFVPVEFTQAHVTNYEFAQFDVSVVSGGIDVVDSLCPADLALDDNVVGVADLLVLLDAWGTADPFADLDGDGIVGFTDLILLLAAWGACP